MEEREYRDYIYQKAEKVKTKKDLDNLLKEVIKNKDLDYGKIVYAISACMLATCNYINRSPVGGITGFQAGCVGWEMVREFIITWNNEFGMKIINYGDLLYPQCEYKSDKTISPQTWNLLQKRARELLKESPNAHPDVIKHWESIIAGKVPFGYVVKDD